MTDFIKLIRLTLTSIAEFDHKYGIFKLVAYTCIISIIVAIWNIDSLVKLYIHHEETIKEENHQKRLQLRDELMDELPPLLTELRARSGAQRILYFEYHNSTENFAGIPFKFANLVAQNIEYGTQGFDLAKYRDINSGLLGSIYTELKKKEVVINNGKETSEFYKNYPEIHEFFSTQDGSKQQVFINIPGVYTPIGMMVLEWMEPTDMTEEEWNKLEDFIIRYSVPRINRLIQSKSE